MDDGPDTVPDLPVFSQACSVDAPLSPDASDQLIFLLAAKVEAISVSVGRLETLLKDGFSELKINIEVLAKETRLAINNSLQTNELVRQLPCSAPPPSSDPPCISGPSDPGPPPLQ